MIRNRILSVLWPRSLRGQVLLAIALALFLAQGIGALLLYRAQHERIEGALVHSAAMRVIGAARGDDDGAPNNMRGGHGNPMRMAGGRVEVTAVSPQRPGERRDAEQESELRQILAEQELPVQDLVVVHRAVISDERAVSRYRRIQGDDNHDRPEGDVLVAGVRLQNAQQWLVARVFIPPAERVMLQSLFGQTLFIYAVLVSAVWLLLRRITRPLAALTVRLEHFARTRDPEGQLSPEGPDDVARLITAHNAMEGKICALLDEKDVMLGAIGHDLKTPLAALRVRIESVEDDVERQRMATTIEDITRTLDDILSLARVGRPTDELETTELSALVASVVEEYEDMGEPVELGDTTRMALKLRPTWVRRALRNLIGNGLRYGQTAHVSLEREGDVAVIRVSDTGPGIDPAEITRMLEPFTRGDPSRNTETGGAGLGLTLARAIAEQHGGTLGLANITAPDGAVQGLLATLRLPLK
jgi:signal transduction histidine kinase